MISKYTSCMENSSDDADPVAEARAEVIEALKQAAEIYGLNQSYGHLYGVLFFADEPLSLDELVERSGYAKSTVSTGMKTMQRLHLVHRRSIPGEGKKVFYEAQTDFWQVIQEFLRREVQREIDIMTQALASAEDQLEAVDSERAAEDLERVRKLKSMYTRSETVVDILTSQSVDHLAELVNKIRG